MTNIEGVIDYIVAQLKAGGVLVPVYPHRSDDEIEPPFVGVMQRSYSEEPIARRTTFGPTVATFQILFCTPANAENWTAEHHRLEKNRVELAIRNLPNYPHAVEEHDFYWDGWSVPRPEDGEDFYRVAKGNKTQTRADVWTIRVGCR